MPEDFVFKKLTVVVVDNGSGVVKPPILAFDDALLGNDRAAGPLLGFLPQDFDDPQLG
ncbi:hypothetical protein ACN2XU_05770 [Primorskyibacter sp. 2E107]|uniref:hypothetical protein n=1 Tax=Primorskyibacter sp. 2E107 TaxID=3403458 RepID=UPI003AF91C9F